MVVGRFGDTSGRPYVTSRVLIRALGFRGNVSFAFDTCADYTTLMPADGKVLGIKYDELERMANLRDSSIRRVVSQGVGGRAVSYIVPSCLVFFDPTERKLYGYALKMLVHQPGPEEISLPSLLGRDIIDRWHFDYDKPGKGLTAKVLSADNVVQLQ